MEFGICTSVDSAGIVKAAGWDFVEESVTRLFQAQTPDSQWQGQVQVSSAPLPVPAANGLVPAELKITGPDADPQKLSAYMSTVIRRAAATGTEVLVFGSGGARKVIEGFDRDIARKQIIEFLNTSAAIAARHQVTLVIEPLNRKECNIINSVAEAMDYVREADHPNLMCLLDTFHFWAEDEPLANLKQAAQWIRHVHVADKVGRVAPGESGQADYRPLFGVLKSIGYEARISVEAKFPDIAGTGARVLAFLKRQWAEA